MKNLFALFNFLFLILSFNALLAGNAPVAALRPTENQKLLPVETPLVQPEVLAVSSAAVSTKETAPKEQAQPKSSPAPTQQKYAKRVFKDAPKLRSNPARSGIQSPNKPAISLIMLIVIAAGLIVVFLLAGFFLKFFLFFLILLLVLLALIALLTLFGVINLGY